MRGGVNTCDISKYAIRNSKKEVADSLFNHNAKNKLNFKNNEFDLVISLGVFHNLYINELSIALSEMDRVGKNKYLLVESYRNSKELFNLQCCGLTAVSLFKKSEWEWVYNKFNYKGDYEFYYFV